MTTDLLRDAETYLSALHGSVSRHDNLAANLGCAGCELRDKIRDALHSAVTTDRTALRDRIRRAVCEAEGFGWDTDMLEPDEYGEVADAVLAVLPAPVDRAAVEAERDSLGREADRLRKDWVEMRAQTERAEAVLARIGQMADAWEQRLPEVIRTPAVVSAIRAAIPGMYAHVGFRLEDVLNEADEAQQPETQASGCASCGHRACMGKGRRCGVVLTSDSGIVDPPCQCTGPASAGEQPVEPPALHPMECALRLGAERIPDNVASEICEASNSGIPTGWAEFSDRDSDVWHLTDQTHNGDRVMMPSASDMGLMLRRDVERFFGPLTPEA